MTGYEARALRRGIGLSARDVAEQLGTNESTVYRWEWRKDRSVPRMYAGALRDLVRLITSQRKKDDDDNEQCG